MLINNEINRRLLCSYDERPINEFIKFLNQSIQPDPRLLIVTESLRHAKALEYRVNEVMNKKTLNGEIHSFKRNQDSRVFEFNDRILEIGYFCGDLDDLKHKYPESRFSYIYFCHKNIW